MGTPYYLSPECWTGKAALAPDKADVWALGVILFELLAVRRPWEGRSVMQLASRICTCDKASLPGGVDEGLGAVVETMLEKDASKRASCREVLKDKCLSGAVSVLYIPEDVWDPTFGRPAPRQALAPSSFLFVWGLKGWRPQCVEALMHKNVKQASAGHTCTCAYVLVCVQ